MEQLLTALISLCTALTLAGCAPTGLQSAPLIRTEPIVAGTLSPGKGPGVLPDITAQPSPEPSTEPENSSYVFGTPLAQSETVEDEYFDNVVFLGDSRTEGLQLFGRLYRGDYYWARGMNVFLVDNANYHTFDVDGETLTMIGALAKKSYDAVYIMLGVNELGCAPSSYEQGLRAFVDKVLAVQPEAVIYLQTLPPINEEKAHAYGMESYINNANVNRFNEVIARVAGEKKVVLLDTAEVYRDENGSLPADLSADGCHFNSSGYIRWVDYLRCHVMDGEEYRSLRAQTSEELSADISKYTQEETGQ